MARDLLMTGLIGRAGHARWPWARFFLRKNGAPRTALPQALQTRARNFLLGSWIEADQRRLAQLYPGSAPTLKCCSIGPLDEAGGEEPTEGTGPVEIEEFSSDRDRIFRVVSHDHGAREVLILVAAGSRPMPYAVQLLRDALVQNKGAALAYGDEVHVDASGRPTGHWFKPGSTDPLLLTRGALLGGCVAVDPDAPGAETLLRDIRRGNRPMQAALSAFAADLPLDAIIHLAHTVVESRQVPAPLPAPPLELPVDLPTVSVLIPTRNGWDLLGPCLASLRETDWPPDRFEILVIDNGSDDPGTLRELAALEDAGQIRVLRDTGPFNFARLNNLAARSARGDLLVMLNNDTRARRPGWLKAMARHALQPDVGAVGCKLLYPDGKVQHAGVVFGIRGGAQHAFIGLDDRDGGYNNLATLDRQVTGVTAACLAVSRGAYDSVGGMREDLAVSYNDVVFCADLHASGYRNICVAEALFDHYESKSRGKDQTAPQKTRHRAERARAIELHPDLFEQDPFYSRHLSRKVLYALLNPPA